MRERSWRYKSRQTAFESFCGSRATNNLLLIKWCAFFFLLKIQCVDKNSYESHLLLQSICVCFSFVAASRTPIPLCFSFVAAASRIPIPHGHLRAAPARGAGPFGSPVAAFLRPVQSFCRPKSQLPASAGELIEQAKKLRAEADELVSVKRESEIAFFREEQTKADKVAAYRSNFSATLPILKDTGKVVEESVYFAPRISQPNSEEGDDFDGMKFSSEIIRVDVPLPLGIVLGQEAGETTVSIDEIDSSANAVSSAKLRVGDILRCCSATTTQMSTPTWQLLVGGIGQPKTVRFMYSCDGERSNFEEVLEAISSNRMDVEGRDVVLVLERKIEVTHQKKLTESRKAGRKMSTSTTALSALGSDEDHHHVSSESASTFKPIFTLTSNAPLKLGGLRMLLSLVLVSSQNKPEKGSWTPRQTDKELRMRWNKTGDEVIITLFERGVSVSRESVVQNLEYLLHESLLLHSVLDELEELSSDPEILEENRLISFTSVETINTARNMLLARKEKKDE